MNMRVSRADRSRIAEWWFTVDHVLLGAILAIVGAGLVFSLAASPAVAIRKGLPTYYFVERHFLFSIAGVLIMLFVNDSKATNADSAEKALSSFAGDIHWILGGRPKTGGNTSQ
jgi:UDP-N-acetylmuramoylalanine-D-glutamate ligase